MKWPFGLLDVVNVNMTVSLRPYYTSTVDDQVNSDRLRNWEKVSQEDP